MKSNNSTAVKKGYSRCQMHISNKSPNHDYFDSQEMMITWHDDDGELVEKSLSFWAKKLGYSSGYLRDRVSKLPLSEAMKPATQKNKMSISRKRKSKQPEKLKVLPSGITEAPPLTLRK